MTKHTPTDPDQGFRRAVLVAPLGVHTRYTLAIYLRHTFMICCALLAIALTIDIWPQFRLVSEAGEPGIVQSIWRVARFEILRTPDLLSPLVPFSVFLGVVWSEIARTQSGERMLVWNSGRSPLQCLPPAIILGVIIGLAQFISDAYIGPAAMAVQIRERLGLNGVRLDRSRNSGSHWIASPDGLIRTEIEYGPPLTLRNLTIYKLDPRGRLTEVESAEEGHSIAGTESWLLTKGHFWLGSIDASGSANPQSSVSFDDMPEETLIPFSRQTVSLKISPLWLSKIGIDTQYLSLPVLHALATADTDPLAKSRYRTRLQTVYADLLFPTAMAVLAALMAVRAFSYRTPPRPRVGVLLAGYLAHFANKAFVLMGTHGYLGAGFAAWTIPALVLAGIGGVAAISLRRRPKAAADSGLLAQVRA